MGNWPWEARVRSSLWSAGMGHRNYRLLSLVAQWPRSYVDFAKHILREEQDSRNTDRALKILRDMDRPYIEGIREGRNFRHATINRGFNSLARIDRVANNNIPAAIEGPRGTGNSLRHDDGAMDVVGQFARGGLEVANGWRSRERFPGGGIEPDFMVHLPQSPFGPGLALWGVRTYG